LLNNLASRLLHVEQNALNEMRRFKAKNQLEQIMKKQLRKITVLGVALMGVGASVQALPIITGDVNFSGVATFSSSAGGSFFTAKETSYKTVSSLTVAGDGLSPAGTYEVIPPLVGLPASFNVPLSTFSFLNRNLTSAQTFGDPTYDLLTGAISGGTELWSFSSGSGTSKITYSFYITSNDAADDFGIVHGGLSMGGDGIGFIQNYQGKFIYAPTDGNWTIDDTQTSPSSPISFVEETSFALVPDGGVTASLLGLGMLGCALFGRKMTKVA
jgi:hypothetical protein